MEYFEFNLLKYVVIEKKYIYNLDYLNYKLRIEKMKCKICICCKNFFRMKYGFWNKNLVFFII